MAIERDTTNSPASFNLTDAGGGDADDYTGTSASFSPPANSVLTVCALCDTGAATTPAFSISDNKGGTGWTIHVERYDTEGTGGFVGIASKVIDTDGESGMTVTVNVFNTGAGAGTQTRGRAWVDVWTGCDVSAHTGDTGEGSDTNQEITPTAIVTTVNGSQTLGIAEDWNSAGAVTSDDQGESYDDAFISGFRAYKAAPSSGVGTNVTLNFDGTGAARDWNWVALELLPTVTADRIYRGIVPTQRMT